MISFVASIIFLPNILIYLTYFGKEKKEINVSASKFSFDFD
jgi:hypothetical protein